MKLEQFKKRRLCHQTDLSLYPGSSSELCVNLASPYFFYALSYLICKLRLITALNSQSNCKIKSILYVKCLNSAWPI